MSPAYAVLLMFHLMVAQVAIPRPSLEGAEPQVTTRIQEVAAAVQEAPNKGDAWGAYAIALHAHSYDAEADRAYAQAQQLDRVEFRWPYFRSVLLAKTDVQRSLELLEQAISLDPEYGPAHDRRAVMLEGLGRDEEAEQAYLEAIRLDPQIASANLHLGQFELKRGNIESAIRYLEAAREQWPASVAVLSSLARATVQLGDRDRARQFADAARQGRKMPPIADPRLNEVAMASAKLNAYLSRVDSYNRAGQVEAAEAELKEALRIGHDAGRVNDVLARVQFNLGKYAESVDSGQIALAAGRNNAILHHTMARSLLRLKKPNEAERSIEAGLAVAPSDGQLLRLKGELAAARGDDQQAIELWSSALRQQQDAKTRRLRALALSRLGQHEKAIAELKLLADSNPKDGQLRFALGEGYRNANQLDNALAAFDQAAEHATVSLPGRAAAAVLVTQRKFLEAKRRLIKMRSRWPRDPNVANDLAWLLSTCPNARVRFGAKAVELMELTLRQQTQSNPALLDTYAAALAETGRFEQALAVLDSALALLPDDAEDRRASFAARRQAYTEEKPWRAE